MFNEDPKFATEGTYTPDNLIADDFPLVTDTITLISGQNLARGAVLGKITASGKYTLSLSASADGSQTPAVILLQDTDATSADKKAPVALTGAFNERALVLGTGHTAASIKDGLRDLSIFLRSSVKA
jgi:hypothetical protein